MNTGIYSKQDIIRNYSNMSVRAPVCDICIDETNSGRIVISEVTERELLLISLLENELDTKFTEGEANYYACVKMTVEGIEQHFFVCIDKNCKVDMPIKVIPLVPSGRDIFRYKDKVNTMSSKLFSIINDADNPGEINLATLRMNRIVDKYRQGEKLDELDVKDFVQEIADWTARMTGQREKARNRMEIRKADKCLHKYDYAKGVAKECRRIVLSDRAYASIVAEALSRDPLETGGILLGHYKNGTWYVVESTDPGLDTSHTTVHHEMDQKYHNHIYPVISRVYEEDLVLLGLWHRHPGSLNKFSSDDNKTNTEYAKVVENGSLSFLFNFVPEAQLTCYYFDYKNTGAYYQPKVQIGDKYFEGTNYLKIASEKTLSERKEQMKTELIESAV